MSDTAYVRVRPDCDIHTGQGTPGVPAEYDGKTTAGPWANMCGPCFGTHGIGLGTGRGQRLVVGERPPRPAPGTVDLHRLTVAEIEELVGDGDIAEWL
jgi:hypothetical protein